MAKIKPSRADAAIQFNGFPGIGQTTPLGKGCDDMCNFRMKQDGSLIPRTGYRKLFSFPGETIRGVWDGTLEGIYHCFIAAGTRVYLLNLDNHSKTVVTTVPTGSGDVTFLCYEGSLYLFTGNAILTYSVSSKSFFAVIPYIPLYGENWDPVEMGSVKEGFNLLTPMIHVHYKNLNGSKEFHLPFYAKSVEKVRMGSVDTDNFTLSATRNRITLPSDADPLELDIVFTVDLKWDALTYLEKTRTGFVHRGIQKDRMFLSGEYADGAVYPSSAISDNMLQYCRSFYPTAKPLYFGEEDVLHLGNRDDPINCFLMHRDKVYAFSKRQGWMLFEEDGKVNAIRATEQIGTGSFDAATSCGEKIALAGADGLYLLSSLLSHPENLSLQHIPYPISLRINASFAENALLYWYGERSELWVRDKTDLNGSVWIWNTNLQAWYRFDGISAVFFHHIAEGECFGTSNGTVYLFDPALYTDDDRSILLKWCSGAKDFDMPETMRRALRISLVGDLGGESADLTVTRDGITQTRTLTGNAGGGTEHFDIRFPLQRHRFVEISLSLPATSNTHLYKLCGYTKI